MIDFRKHPIWLAFATAVLAALVTVVLLSQNEVPAVLYEAF